MATFNIKQEKDVPTGSTTQPTETDADGTCRRSKRQRAAPKTYDEALIGQAPAKSKKQGRAARWKEEELEKLLDCLKKYQRPDSVQSLKKHVKTKNVQQVEAKLEYLKKKALDRAMDETVGMPPLQCWEMLAKDVTNTLDDESYKELSKVFLTEGVGSTSGNKRRVGGKTLQDPNQPNYNEIYKFLAALLRGSSSPPELSPIDSMVVLECLNNTVEFLQNVKTKNQSAFLEKRYQECFLSLYSDGDSQKRRGRPPLSSFANDEREEEEEEEEEELGLGTLNPFKIPVNRLNLIHLPPCEEHGNMYCWVPECREAREMQRREQPGPSSSTT